MKRRFPALALFSAAVCLLFSSCASTGSNVAGWDNLSASNAYPGYLNVVDDDADTVDPQCTTDYYTVALNVFDRLVEIRTDDTGKSYIEPSLADSWNVSADGLVYTFHLREGVMFSNGSPLTASDVNYTLHRLLTHPDSCNQDIASFISGSDELRSGTEDVLCGFRLRSDYEFAITLSRPYSAFLACLSTPGASILDEETTRLAGADFGKTAEATIGTGPYVITEWKRGTGMVLTANQNCWSGPPQNAGVRIRAIRDSETQRLQFERGTLDLLDLDKMGVDAEYFIHGDIYQDTLVSAPRVGIDYIALNERVKPLDDVRVRKALQLALDREALLNIVISGRGYIENGILPRGLIGHATDLPEIPFDRDAARQLLSEAGLADGFGLKIELPESSSQSRIELMTLAAAMWRKIGVNATIVIDSDEAFLKRRRDGVIACYSNQWSADYNDPDNFLYTFFGTWNNTRSRSLCYGDAETIENIQRARAISDEAARMREYQALERKIVQDDAAWIPLFSREHYFVVNDRVSGFRVSWNGWSNTVFRNITVSE